MDSHVPNAIPSRAPRLLESRSSKTPLRVRVAPEPMFERPAPRLEWSSTAAGWEEAEWLASGALLHAGGGEDRITIAIPLAFDRGADQETELTEAGAR